jgi:hypothetical protein
LVNPLVAHYGEELISGELELSLKEADGSIVHVVSGGEVTLIPGELNRFASMEISLPKSDNVVQYELVISIKRYGL